MKILSSTELFVPSHEPIALSIGNFDGVHLGHQAVLTRLKQAAPHTVIFTFSNHPSEVLHGVTIPRLTTLTHRLALLEKGGIDQVILVPFTLPFSLQTAQTFLTDLKKHIPFSTLILGHDAVIGHDRKHDLSSPSFSIEYLPPITHNGQIVSSSIIRKHIQNGELDQASQLLGRPYSIAATVEPGHGKGRNLGFQTANLPVEQLVLPPFGVYAVQVVLGAERLPAIANLGRAPTLHASRPPCLEVHLLHEERNLYGQTLDVIFQQFIRPEKKFDSPSALQAQIERDINFLQKG